MGLIVLEGKNISVAEEGHGIGRLDTLGDVVPVGEFGVALLAGSAVHCHHGNAPLMALFHQLVGYRLVAIDARSHFHGERNVEQLRQRADRLLQRVAPLHQPASGALDHASIHRKQKFIFLKSSTNPQCPQKCLIKINKYFAVDSVDGAAKIQVDEINVRLFLQQLAAFTENVRITPTNLHDRIAKVIKSY